MEGDGRRAEVIDGSMKSDDLMNEWLAVQISLVPLEGKKESWWPVGAGNGRCGSRRESRPTASMI